MEPIILSCSAHMRLTPMLTVIGNLATSYPRRVLACCLALVVSLSYGAIGLTVDTDFTNAFPRDHEDLQAFFSLDTHFANTDRIVLAVEAPAAAATPEEAAQRQELVERLTAQMNRWQYTDQEAADSASSLSGPMIGHVIGHLSQEQHDAVLQTIIGRTWLWLPDEQLDNVIKRLQPRVVEKRLERGPPADVPPALAAHDPLGLWPRSYAPFWEGTTNPDAPMSYQDGFLMTRDRSTFLIVALPRLPIKNLHFSIAISKEMNALEQWFAAQPEAEGLTLHLASGYLAASRDFSTAKSSAIATSIASVIGIFVLFGIAYRSLRLIILIGLTMIPSIIATAGAAGFLFDGKLSLLASVFGAILIGLGVDAIIHIYNAYCWALKHVDTQGEINTRRAAAARHALLDVGPGVVAGGLTSVGTFLVLIFSNFGSIVEFGLISALGLSITMLFVVFALPALLTLMGSTQQGKKRTQQGLRPFARILLRHPATFAVCSGIIIFAALTTLARSQDILPIEGDLRALRPQDDTLLEQSKRAQEYGLHFSGYEILFESMDEQSVLTALSDGIQRLESLDDPIPLRPTRNVLISRKPVDFPAEIIPEQYDLNARHVIEYDGRKITFDSYENGVFKRARLLEKGQPLAIAANDPCFISPIIQQQDLSLLETFAPQQQRERLLRLQQEVPLNDLQQLLANADTTTRTTYAPFMATMNDFITRAQNPTPVLLADYASGPLQPLLDEAYRVDDTGMVRVRLSLPLNHDRNQVPYQELCTAIGLDELVASHPNVHIGIGGVARVADFVDREILTDFIKLTGIALIVTAILVAVAMQRISYTLMCITTLAIGIAITMAIMVITGLRWHVLNLAVLPLIIGIGIDNGIHLSHALKGHYRSGAYLLRALSQTGFPIVMTALTTIVGFGSLLLNAYVGVQELGAVAAIAMFACLFASLICMPLIALATTHRKRTGKDGLPMHSRLLPAVTIKKKP